MDTDGETSLISDELVELMSDLKLRFSIGMDTSAPLSSNAATGQILRHRDTLPRMLLVAFPLWALFAIMEAVREY